MGKPYEDKDDDLLEKYNTICDIVTIDISKYDSEPVYNKTFFKTKLKFYGDQDANFYDEETSKVGSDYTYIVAITLNLVLKKMDTTIYDQFLRNINIYLGFRVK